MELDSLPGEYFVHQQYQVFLFCAELPIPDDYGAYGASG